MANPINTVSRQVVIAFKLGKGICIIGRIESVNRDAITGKDKPITINFVCAFRVKSILLK